MGQKALHNFTLILDWIFFCFEENDLLEAFQKL